MTATTTAQALYAEGWRVTSRKYRCIARLPPGESGADAYRRCSSPPRTLPEHEAADLYRRMYAEREGHASTASATVIVELARITGDARCAEATATAKAKRRKR